MTTPIFNNPLRWVQNGEPASGGIRGNNSGVVNRTAKQLLENTIYLKNRLDSFSDEESLNMTYILNLITETQGITNTNVQVDAEIEESKLSLELKNHKSISNTNYSNTGEIASDILFLKNTLDNHVLDNENDKEILLDEISNLRYDITFVRKIIENDIQFNNVNNINEHEEIRAEILNLKEDIKNTSAPSTGGSGLRYIRWIGA